MKRKVPSYPPILDEYCISTAYQTNTNRERNVEPVIKMRCFKRDLNKVYNRQNPWNKFEGYYYEEYIGSADNISHLSAMSEKLAFKRIDLGENLQNFISKAKESIYKTWAPGVNMTRKMASNDINFTPLNDNINGAFKIWTKLFNYWTK